MNAATANLINHGANFMVAVLDDDDDDAQMMVDARTLDPARLWACVYEAPDVDEAAVFYFATGAGLWHVTEPEVWLMQYVGAYADTADGLRDTLAKLTGRARIPGVDDDLNTQDRLDAWSVQLALFDQMQPWFPWTVDYSALVNHIKRELADLDDEVTA